MGTGRTLVAVALLAWAGGCVPAAPPTEPPPVPTGAMQGPRVSFGYTTIDGASFDPQSFGGRLGVIGFVTTFDMASQAQARFLSALLQHHSPRLNVAILVLEQRENLPLVTAFAGALHLRYPVALADDATIAGNGPFPGLHHVPSVVILDREGRQAYVHVGLMDERALDEAAREVEKETARRGDP